MYGLNHPGSICHCHTICVRMFYSSAGVMFHGRGVLKASQGYEDCTQVHIRARAHSRLPTKTHALSPFTRAWNLKIGCTPSGSANYSSTLGIVPRGARPLFYESPPIKRGGVVKFFMRERRRHDVECNSTFILHLPGPD